MNTYATRVGEIQERYETVKGQIAETAQTCGRSPESVRLVVVTKTHPLETVRAVVEAGARDLGENYAEEALEKIEALSAPDDVNWHMIGHVQSRKAQLVSEHFDLLHSLDSLKLANHLEHFAVLAERRLPVLLECNVSGEENKYGFLAWQESQPESLAAVVEQILALPHLELRGLMTMPPYTQNAEDSRAYFSRLRRLLAWLSGRFPQATWDQLSMGTSADFTVAVQEGATLVRVGTAILGPRATGRTPDSGDGG